MVKKCTSRGIAEIAVMEVAHEVGVRTRARAAMAMADKKAAAAAAAPSSVTTTAKRRKVTTRTTTTRTGELAVKLSTTSYVELRNRKRVVIASRTENLVIPTTAESNIGRRHSAKAEEEEVNEKEEQCVTTTSPISSSDLDVHQVSCCSSNGSSEIADVDHDHNYNHNHDHHDDDEQEVDESAEVETSTYNSCRETRREMTPSSKLREESDDVESAAKPASLADNSQRRSVVAHEKMPSELEIEEFFAVAEKNVQKRFAEKYNFDIVKDTPLEGRYEWVRLKP